MIASDLVDKSILVKQGQRYSCVDAVKNRVPVLDPENPLVCAVERSLEYGTCDAEANTEDEKPNQAVG